MSSNIVVRVSHRYTAPVDRVFDAWITPSQASRFFFATRTGNVMRCEMQPEPGGHFVVTDRRPQADGDESVMDAEHRGEYIEVDRPKRLVFDFSVPPYSDVPSRVAIDFQPLSWQSCELVLTHDLGDSDMARAYEAQTREGWAKMLAKLERELFPRRIGVQL
ncbi:MAG: SRPBCC domain-containing protein [Burkholderiales bacterium]|nr:SRPBCC domain-containing protein [Burkholderiales bacterium]